MNLYLVGCECAGKTTLTKRISQWAEETMGGPMKFHDHFTIPTQEFSPPAARQYREAHPQIKEMLQRLMIEYHASTDFYDHVHHNVVGAAIEDAVYAPLYYGYGGKESGAPHRSPEGQRTAYARRVESRIMKRCPNVVLVLMKASPEVIRRRIRESPPVKPGEPTRGVVKGEDVELVLKRFDEEFEAALIENKITLDTTSATEEETLAEFLEKHEPFMTEDDRERIRKHQAGSRARSRNVPKG